MGPTLERSPDSSGIHIGDNLILPRARQTPTYDIRHTTSVILHTSKALTNFHIINHYITPKCEQNQPKSVSRAHIPINIGATKPPFSPFPSPPFCLLSSVSCLLFSNQINHKNKELSPQTAATTQPADPYLAPVFGRGHLSTKPAPVVKYRRSEHSPDSSRIPQEPIINNQ